MSDYTIEQFPIGPMGNFGYLIVDAASGEAAVVDPAWDAGEYRRRAESAGARITQVILTHSHDDHVNALDGFGELPLRIGAAEADFWSGTPDGATLMHDGDTSTLGQTTLRWLLTPGHTPGSMCLLLERDLISADTLFVYGCGRCDLGGSDAHAMHASLSRLVRDVPPEVVIHPGHDYGVAPTSTMAEQLEGNPFLMFDDADAFATYRLKDHGKLRSQPFGPESAPYPDGA